VNVTSPFDTASPKKGPNQKFPRDFGCWLRSRPLCGLGHFRKKLSGLMPVGIIGEP